MHGVFVLILVFGGFRALASEQIEFKTEEQCNAVLHKIKAEYSEQTDFQMFATCVFVSNREPR